MIDQAMVSSTTVSSLLQLIPIATTPANGVPASQWLPAMLVSVGIVIMLVLWTMSLRGRSARKHAEYVTPREQIDRIKAGHRTREVENTLSAEFVTSATELAARLENKAERLEQLIEQADGRIAQLDQLMERDVIKSPQSSPIMQSKASPPAPPAPAEPADPLVLAVCELADSGLSPIEIAQRLDEQVGKVELILALRQQ